MSDRKTFNVHQWVEERLSEYLDDRLAPDELARLETHLRDCDRCQASLASLGWTVSLLKQAPVPAPSRAFTLPVARSEPRASRPSFAFLRVVTVMATLVLCLVVGLDLFTQLPPIPAAAPLPAAQFAAPTATQNVALAPQATSAPAPTFAPQQPASQPLVLPTATRAANVGAAEAQATTASDQTLKTSATALAPRAVTTITSTLPSAAPISAPSVTATVPTATAQLQARAEPTRGRDSNAEPARIIAPSLRVLEIGLLGLVVVLGALTIFAWRRK